MSRNGDLSDEAHDSIDAIFYHYDRLIEEIDERLISFVNNCTDDYEWATEDFKDGLRVASKVAYRIAHELIEEAYS